MELHGATRYLFQQFGSPHSNKRDNEFAVPHFFAIKLIEEVKAVVKEHADKPFLIGYRFSSEEPEIPGITMKETFALTDELIVQELDYLHIATTNAWTKQRRGNESERSRTELISEYIDERVPVFGVWNLHTPEEAAQVLEEGQTVLIFLGRALVADPYWVEKVAAGQEDSIQHYLTPETRKDRVIPAPLWEQIMEVDGWFSVKHEAQTRSEG